MTDASAFPEPGAAPARALVPLVLPAAAFAASAPVLRLVPLQFGPYTFAGRDWSAIGIRRLSVEQIAACLENYRINREIDPAFPFTLPIYVAEDGEPIPAGLLDKLDPDDADTVDEEGEGFLPRRYRVTKARSPSASPTGAATAPSSSA